MSSLWTTRLPPSSRPEPGYLAMLNCNRNPSRPTCHQAASTSCALSDLGYHLDEKDCHQLASLAMNTARDLVAVHWRHRVEDHPLTGDQVHPVIQQAATNHGLERICSHIEADFRLAVQSRDQPSVASRSGLISS